MRSSQVACFLAVYDAGSVAGAARTLERSRTTVSTAVAALEDELGVSLFERSGNRLAPSSIARSIERDCRRMLQAVGQVEARCRHHRSGAESELRIARDDSLPEAVWRRLLRELKARFPQTSVSVYLAPPRELAEFVARQQVDVAYGLMPDPLSEGYQWFRELADVRMVTVVAPEHPLAALAQVQQDDLVSHTEIAMASMTESGLVPEAPESGNYLAFAQYELIRDAVMEGAGWADLPFPLVAEALREQRLVVLRHRSAHWWKVFSALESEQTQGGPVVQWLAQALADYLEPFA